MFRSVAILTLCFASAAVAQTSVQQPLAYSECVQRLETPITGAVGDPVTLVDTDQIKQVQYLVTDGMVTITCTAADQQVTITHSASN
jgi:hypothetical protein